MRKFVTFLKYNNAIPIAFTVLMVGAASTYAAANPEVIIEKTEEVISIDNSYIAEINLKKYTPTARIVSVKEDDIFYYVEFDFSTIELKDFVWQDITVRKEIRVEKGGLGPYRDLGLYVTEQLKELIDHELQRLRETQKFEIAQRSEKKVVVAYSGLVGGFLSDKVETIKGYKPVVVPPKPVKEKETFARPDPNAQFPKPQPVEKKEDVSNEENNEDNKRPVVTVLGEKNVRVALGGAYVDLGATVLDDRDTDIVLELYLNGAAVESVVIDTSVIGTYEIMYFAEDSGGKTDGEVRRVEVYDPALENQNNGGGSESPSVDQNTSTTSATTSDPVTEPEPAPLPVVEDPEPTVDLIVEPEPVPEPTPEPVPEPTPEVVI